MWLTSSRGSSSPWSSLRSAGSGMRSWLGNAGLRAYHRLHCRRNDELRSFDAGRVGVRCFRCGWRSPGVPIAARNAR
jgi:hypothetical protein